VIALDEALALITSLLTKYSIRFYFLDFGISGYQLKSEVKTNAAPFS
jgi:hypothetical protein